MNLADEGSKLPGKMLVWKFPKVWMGSLEMKSMEIIRILSESMKTTRY